MKPHESQPTWYRKSEPGFHFLQISWDFPTFGNIVGTALLIFIELEYHCWGKPPLIEHICIIFSPQRATPVPINSATSSIRSHKLCSLLRKGPQHDYSSHFSLIPTVSCQNFAQIHKRRRCPLVSCLGYSSNAQGFYDILCTTIRIQNQPSQPWRKTSSIHHPARSRSLTYQRQAILHLRRKIPVTPH